MDLPSGLAEQELARRALHDDLTGLPNRALLVDRLQNALGRAARDHEMVAVFYCDMDHFKHVNDSIGHRSGVQPSSLRLSNRGYTTERALTACGAAEVLAR